MAEADHNMAEEEETSPDVLGFNLKPANTSKPIIIPVDDALKFDPASLYYDMSGDKYLVILNQHTFKKTIYFKNRQPSTRHGTDNDVKGLKSLFQNFGFKVEVHRDLVYDEIMKNLREVATRNHTKTSCICVTVLTHGDRGGELNAADRPYLLSDILNIFENQPDLVNKPKLFFIQINKMASNYINNRITTTKALRLHLIGTNGIFRLEPTEIIAVSFMPPYVARACRGDKMDAGNTVHLDSEAVLTVPTHADFLILRSTVEDYLSYRDANGSWMIQALCHVISKHHKELDLLHMITLMNRKVAYERLTYTPKDLSMSNKKQMPETRFTLTKQLKFL